MFCLGENLRPGYKNKKSHLGEGGEQKLFNTLAKNVLPEQCQKYTEIPEANETGINTMSKY